MVNDLDLKWRSYGCLKTTMQSWMEMLQPHQISLLLDTFLEHFMELKLCILYIILKLRKSEIHSFKRCMIWIWNEEVMAVWRQTTQKCENVQMSFKPIFKHPRLCFSFLKAISTFERVLKSVTIQIPPLPLYLKPKEHVLEERTPPCTLGSHMKSLIPFLTS